MNYTKVRLYTSAENMDDLSLILEDNGISGIVIEEPEVFQELLNKKDDFEWDYIDESVKSLADITPSVTFYLEDTQEGIDLLDHILQEIIPLDIEKVEVSSVCDDDWKDNWKQYFKPSRITDRIVIKPSWEEYKKINDKELIIEIDPGMAFGTGTHPTTSMCIKLLEKYIDKDALKVLDIGCGSGILSIAAALLGAGEVLGIDIDPVAIDVAKENVSANSLNSKINIIEGDLTKGLTYRADIVVSNLMADLVISLAKDIKKHMNFNGIYISSGILKEKRELVSDELRGSGLQIVEVFEEDEWCAIAAAYR